jgi:hypothetical protein
MIKFNSDSKFFQICGYPNTCTLKIAQKDLTYLKFDSIQNRNEYAKYFNYRPPGLKLSNNQQLFNPNGMTIGFDLDEIINMFRFHRNRNLQYLQNRLLAQEQEKYVNNRFTKRFVQKLTHLEGDEVVRFMNFSRPTY